jgi:PTS system fructose-specific IIA component
MLKKRRGEAIMLIDENLITMNLSAKTKEEAILLLAEKAKSENRLKDVRAFQEAVLKREEEYSTAVGFGVAIPHGKTDAVIEPFLMFATVQSIDWKALDDKPVDLIFLIGVPEADASTLHLKILASLSRKLMKEEFRTSIRSAATPEEVMKILEESELGL